MAPAIIDHGRPAHRPTGRIAMGGYCILPRGIIMSLFSLPWPVFCVLLCARARGALCAMFHMQANNRQQPLSFFPHPPNKHACHIFNSDDLPGLDSTLKQSDCPPPRPLPKKSTLTSHIYSSCHQTTTKTNNHQRRRWPKVAIVRPGRTWTSKRSPRYSISAIREMPPSQHRRYARHGTSPQRTDPV